MFSAALFGLAAASAGVFRLSRFSVSTIAIVFYPLGFIVLIRTINKALEGEAAGPSSFNWLAPVGLGALAGFALAVAGEAALRVPAIRVRLDRLAAVLLGHEQPNPSTRRKPHFKRRQYGWQDAERQSEQARQEPPAPQTEREKHLAMLGVSDSATASEIKQAYRKLARKHHPDVLRSRDLSGDAYAAAESYMAMINAAFDALTDE